MQQWGGFKLKMKNKKQVEQVLPIIKDSIACLEYWPDNLSVHDSIIEVDTQTHTETCEYPGIVVGFCKEIAEKFPNFEFTIKAECADDEDFFSSYEEGRLKGGKFNYEIYLTETNDSLDDMDFDEVDFDEMMEPEERKITITGNIENKKMVFKESEGGDDDIPETPLIKAIIDQLSEKEFEMVKEAYAEEIEEVLEGEAPSTRDEFSVLLAKAFGELCPYFYDNYLDFAEYLEDFDSPIKVLSEDELNAALDEIDAAENL